MFTFRCVICFCFFCVRLYATNCKLRRILQPYLENKRLNLNIMAKKPPSTYDHHSVYALESTNVLKFYFYKFKKIPKKPPQTVMLTWFSIIKFAILFMMSNVKVVFHQNKTKRKFKKYLQTNGKQKKHYKLLVQHFKNKLECLRSKSPLEP